jgi:hypothetical protein
MRRYVPLVYVAAVAAVVAPPLLVASDIALVMFISTPGLILQRLGLALFAPAVAGVTLLAQSHLRWAAVLGAALAAIGAIAIVWRPETLVIALFPPAVLFPIGLLVVSGAILGSATSGRAAVLMGVAALLFPFGHISGLPPLLIGGDVLLLAAFWMLALQMANPKSQIPNPKSQGTGI